MTGPIYYTDHTGSVREIRAHDKSVLASYAYHPYGESLSTAGLALNRGFTGHHLDAETKNYFAPCRYYSPRAGRWTMRDPLGYVDGANVYGYVGGNPVNLADPSGGQATVAVWGCVAAGPPFLLLSLAEEKWEERDLQGAQKELDKIKGIMNKFSGYKNIMIGSLVINLNRIIFFMFVILTLPITKNRISTMKLFRFNKTISCLERELILLSKEQEILVLDKISDREKSKKLASNSKIRDDEDQSDDALNSFYNFKGKIKSAEDKFMLCHFKSINGDPEEQYHLANMYYCGNGCMQSRKRAYYWYAKAKKNGNPKALNCLKVMKKRGEFFEV